jgi:NEDD8-activating enzyme E1 regulatory subunit
MHSLPGFTIVDDHKVEPRDLGNNFLIERDALGGSRAQCVTELLKELNPAVDGSFMEDTPEELLDSDPGFFPGFTIIIATQVGVLGLPHPGARRRADRNCRRVLVWPSQRPLRRTHCCAHQ